MSTKPNPHPAFAPEGLVFKKFTPQKESAPHEKYEGEYAEVVSGWIVRFGSDEVVFVPRGERR